MAIITLISDWQQNDHYLSALKGKLYSLLPNVNIVDISHQVPAFGFIKAAFILRNSYRSFPKGTVHLVCINSEATPKIPHIAVYNDGHFFLGADNGVFGIMFPDKPEKVVVLEHSTITVFPEYDVFADAAVYLANGGSLENLGQEYTNFNTPAPFRATHEGSVINGSVIYIDSYSNAITNITKELFEKVCKGRRFEILLQTNYYKITKINTYFHETADGELLALFNSANLLEIAVAKGNAAELLSLGPNATIRIKFYDTPSREELKLL
jgi:S-adenosyl-L-methionine hydrolase (adenosine-forming)